MNLYEDIKENLKESTDNIEWKGICQAFCDKIGAELLFVNDDNFGYEDKNGNLVHMYADELEQYLKNNKLKETEPTDEENMHEAEDFNSIKETLVKLLDDNESKIGHLETQYDVGYHDGYHNAMLDVLDILNIDTTESYIGSEISGR